MKAVKATRLDFEKWVVCNSNSWVLISLPPLLVGRLRKNKETVHQSINEAEGNTVMFRV